MREQAAKAEAERAAIAAADAARKDAEAARKAQEEAQEAEMRAASQEAENAAIAEKEAQERQAAEAEQAAVLRQQAAEREAQAEDQARLLREAEDAKRAAEPSEPLRTTITPVAPMLDAEPEAPEPKRGILGRLMGRAAAAPVTRRVLDDAMLEQLEELLITTDMGVDTALRVTANMAEGRLGKKLSVNEIKTLMSDEIARIMEPVAKPLPLYAKTPQVVLVVGVNGSGKTTTIGKLASQFRAAGKKVVIAAGDTFRAAAVEQLQVWGSALVCPFSPRRKGLILPALPMMQWFAPRRTALIC